MKISSLAFAGLLGLASFSTFAADANLKTVEAVYQNKAALAGKTVSVKGKVVKVNNGIMNRNFVHIQDGTGNENAGTNNLVVTSKQTANVGDQVTISGIAIVNRDFGSGYSYPLLIEEAKITASKK